MPGYDGMPDYMDNNAFIGASNGEVAAIGDARAVDSLQGVGHTQFQLDRAGVEMGSLLGQQMVHSAADAARHGEFLATQARPAPHPHFASKPREVAEPERITPAELPVAPAPATDAIYSLPKEAKGAIYLRHMIKLDESSTTEDRGLALLEAFDEIERAMG